jgi:glycerol-3-phosphate acyltransferase PlsY
MFATLTFVLAAYLIGAIPFAWIVARLYGVPDIRKVGSGNVGATNVQRVLGFRAAIWVFLFDILKGALPVLLTQAFVDPAASYRDLLLVAVALTAIVGHVFPVYIGFKGGKGVLTALGSLAVLMPLPVALSVLVFLLVFGLSRFVSLGSMCAALCLPLGLWGQQIVTDQPVPIVYWILSVVLAVLVPLTHRQNIKRLLAGAEHRFSFASSGRKVDNHG